MKLTVDDILKSKGGLVYSVSPNDSVFEAIEEMNKRGVGALMVMSYDKVEGIISERDYARKIVLKGKSSKETLVKDVMSTNLEYARPEQNVHECMQLMTDKRIRHLPVMQKDSLLGLISIGDLVNAVIKEQQFQIDQLRQYIIQ